MPRFEASLVRFEERLLARLFTPAERAYAARKRHGQRNLAARFAAKCAARRCLRRHGIALRLRDVEITRRESGEPTLLIHGLAPHWRFSISLTHDDQFALASVWAEQLQE